MAFGKMRFSRLIWHVKGAPALRSFSAVTGEASVASSHAGGGAVARTSTLSILRAPSSPTGHHKHQRLSELCGRGLLDDAERLFAIIRDTATGPDYAALMSCRLRRGKGDTIQELVDEMKKKKVPLTGGAYKCIMVMMRSKGEPLVHLDELWAEMARTKVTIKPIMLNIYLEHLRDASRRVPSEAPDTAPRMLKFYRWACDKFHVHGDEKTFNLILCAADNEGQQSVVDSVLEDMKRVGMELTLLHALHILNIGLYRRIGTFINLGYERIIKTDPLFLNEGTWMELIKHWAARGSAANILSLEPVLAKRFPESQPSEVFYRSALHALTKINTMETVDGNVSANAPDVAWGDLFRVLHRMEDRGYGLTSRCLLRRVLGPMSITACLDAAYYALVEMRDDTGPNAERVRLSDLNLVIAGCGRTRDLDRAFATLAEVPKFGFKPSLETYVAMLGVCAYSKDADAALHVEKQMLAEGIELDQRCKQHLAAVFSTPQHWRRALEIVKSYAKVPAAQVMHQLVFAIVESGNALEAEDARAWYRERNPEYSFGENLSRKLSSAVADLYETPEEYAYD